MSSVECMILNANNYHNLPNKWKCPSGRCRHRPSRTFLERVGDGGNNGAWLIGNDKIWHSF